MISCTGSGRIGISVVITEAGFWMWALQKVVCSGCVHMYDYCILYVTKGRK